jgi:hypothetical protein
VTSALTNQRRIFKACLTQTERVSDDVTRKIGPLDFSSFFSCPLPLPGPAENTGTVGIFRKIIQLKKYKVQKYLFFVMSARKNQKSIQI